jgi:esterase/lipase superfamily enzyme
MLLSADIDVEVFKSQLKVFPKSKRRFYVLIFENDRALADSPEIVQRIGKRLNEGDALGDTRQGLLQNIPAAAQVLTGAAGSGGILVFN